MTPQEQYEHLVETVKSYNPAAGFDQIRAAYQFAAAWRCLERVLPPEGRTVAYLPALRALASEIGGAEPFLRSALCLEVFRDRGLLTMEREGDAVTLVLQRDRRASLDDAPLVAALKQSMERGGGTL